MSQVILPPPERAQEVLTAEAFDVAAGVSHWIVIGPDTFAVIVGVPDCIKVVIVVFTVPSPWCSTKETLVNIVLPGLYAIVPAQAGGDAVTALSIM